MVQLLWKLEEWRLAVLQKVKHRKFHDIDFLDMTPKAPTNKNKNQQMGLNQT